MEFALMLLVALLCGALIGIAPALPAIIDLWLASKAYEKLHGNDPPVVLTELQKEMQSPEWRPDVSRETLRGYP